jgi:membrane-bound lytic murein transglycosylase B
MNRTIVRGAGSRRWRVALAALLLLVAAAPVAAHEPTFAAWLEKLRGDAAALGVSEATLDAALSGIELIPRIIELDRGQPEVTQTFDEYMARRVTPALVEEGRHALQDHRELLEAVGAAYGVQPRFIVALWGVETRYGKYTGGFPVVAALATLAYDARRGAFFRRQLLDALRIIDGGHVAAKEMTGSWAGAMGQNQFMPSSFMSFAVDHDGDGRKDIWTTAADVFASTANYLARQGWRRDQSWGREVALPEGFDRGLVGLDVAKRAGAWQRLGVRGADGGPLALGDAALRDAKVSIVTPGGPDSAAYMVLDNYRTILKWNRSGYFAVSVGHLADLIGAG